MRPLLHEVHRPHSPESLVERLRGEAGVVLLRSALFESPQARHSFVAARPFLTLRAFASRCELSDADGTRVQFGDPWHLLDALMARYELLDEVDLPFPLGGCFGFWGYDLKNFVEPRLPRRAVNDLELPDCHVGFHDSLVVFDHRLGKTWIVSTGLRPDGSRDAGQARRAVEWWREKLERESAGDEAPPLPGPLPLGGREGEAGGRRPQFGSGPQRRRADDVPPSPGGEGEPPPLQPHCGRARLLPSPNLSSDHGSAGAAPYQSNLSRSQFIANVSRAQRYIRAGDIYQVNLSHRFAAAAACDGWSFFQRLSAVSPAPFSAFLDCGEFQIASSSPEMFLRLSGSHVTTRPIKGTRPRSADPTRDAQLTYELQTSPKEMAELVMITDLMRNDLGRVCEFGSVQVPELVRLERYPQVQHLVSTVEGRLRAGVTHFEAFAKCFPGGSITGAPKIRAMEIIDQLEPLTRGPYTGCLGYLGFNRESQLNIAIRTAVCRPEAVYFHTGAGIVADSVPEAEYEETLAKAGGFFAALGRTFKVQSSNFEL
jgi:para-aminobenzoate synthetase component 1